MCVNQSKIISRNLKSTLGLCLVLLVACVCCVLNAGCEVEETNYRGLNYGRYYLVDNEDVFIEIRKDHIAFLQNLDFSDFDPEEYWGNTKEWELTPVNVDLNEVMQGEKTYYYFLAEQELDIEIYEGCRFTIFFDYNGSDQLEFNGKTYVLSKN